MKQFRFSLLLLAGVLSMEAAAQKHYSLKSPDGNIEVNVCAEGQLSYSVSCQGKVLLEQSPIGLVLEDRTLGREVRVSRKSGRSGIGEVIDVPHHRVPTFGVVYNELDLRFKGNWGVVFRACKEGVAYRFYTSVKQPLVIKDEIAMMNFPEDRETYMAYSTTQPGQDPYALASPNRIGDCSWIKTGKAAWEWWNDWGISGVDFKAGINMETYRHYIDFAAENGLGFVILDEGWYDPGKGDMLTPIPGLDLEELVRYGKRKGVDLMLWTVFNVLDDQLEEACRKYSAMGIAGFKVDFLDRDDQTAVEMAYRIAEATARHKLTLDLHGFYKPTGLDRTYPNVINYESVFGMEEMKWSTVEKDMMEYDVTMPYIRMMAGPVDYTPGAMRNASRRDFKPVYCNPMSQGTRCHQLAAYIVHDSPLTMLADNPTIYRKEQECTDFIVSLPNKGIDETRVLQGRLGEYIITARRAGTSWYVGGMTDWTPREVTLDFSFLAEGDYEVVLFRDGVNAGKQAGDYRKETFRVTPGDRKAIRLASGGGFAMSITRK